MAPQTSIPDDLPALLQLVARSTQQIVALQGCCSLGAGHYGHQGGPLQIASPKLPVALQQSTMSVLLWCSVRSALCTSSTAACRVHFVHPVSGFVYLCCHVCGFCPPHAYWQRWSYTPSFAIAVAERGKGRKGGEEVAVCTLACRY